ncbi:alpha-1D adrenergic receptor-like [Oculina patagonica]
MIANSTNNTNELKNATQEWQANFIPLRAILAPSVLLAVVILIGNSLVILSYKTNKRLRTRTNAFLVSLSISDFLVGSISLPMWIYILIIEFSESVAFNAVFRIFDVFAALASIYHLTAISIERYIAVSRPFYYKCLPSFFHRAMIASAWLVAGLLASLSSLTIVLKISWISQVYSTVLFICGFAVPTAIIARMYVGVFSVARSLLQRNPPRHKSQQSTRWSLMQYYQGQRKVAITVALITGLFIVAWVPFFTVSVTAAYCIHCLPSSPDSLRGLIIIVKCVHYLNSAVNPLVYARRDREMRKTFIRLLRLKRGNFRFNGEEETPWGFPLRPRN